MSKAQYSISLPARDGGRPVSRIVEFVYDPAARNWRSRLACVAVMRPGGATVYRRALRLTPADPERPDLGPNPPVLLRTDGAIGYDASFSGAGVSPADGHLAVGWADEWADAFNSKDGRNDEADLPAERYTPRPAYHKVGTQVELLPLRSGGASVRMRLVDERFRDLDRVVDVPVGTVFRVVAIRPDIGNNTLWSGSFESAKGIRVNAPMAMFRALR